MLTSFENMNVCCICETDRYSRHVGVTEGFSLFKCHNCGLVYLNGQKHDPLNFMRDAKNRKIEYWSLPTVYEKYSFIFERFFKERLLRCLKYKKEIASMFDIGCGYGFWMDYCRRAGIKVKGIDISGEAVNHGKEVLKLDVEVSSLTAFNFKERYDLYNFSDVLEHLENPNKELRILCNAMSQDALLYIQIPDVLGIRIPFRHNLGLPHHIWQFNFRTIKRLLNKNGFSILKKWHGIQGVVGAYVCNKVSALTKLKWLIAQNFNLGNRLIILCRKRISSSNGK